MAISLVELASYVVLSITAYSIAVVILSRNFRNVATRWLASALFVISANIALSAYRFFTGAVFDAPLAIIGLALHIASYSLFYMSLKSFIEFKRTDYIALFAPIVMLAYSVAVVLVTGSTSIYTIRFLIVLPSLAFITAFFTYILYLGYQVYAQIEQPFIRMRFLYLIVGVAIYGYSRLANNFAAYFFDTTITGLVQIAGLLIVAYAILGTPKPRSALRRRFFTSRGKGTPVGI